MVRANRACQRCLKDVTELNSCGSYAVESTDISVSKTEESRAMVVELMELANAACLSDVTGLNSCGSYAVESTHISVQKS